MQRAVWRYAVVWVIMVGVSYAFTVMSTRSGRGGRLVRFSVAVRGIVRVVFPVIVRLSVVMAVAWAGRQRRVTWWCCARNAPKSEPMAPAPSMVMVRGRDPPQLLF